MKEAKKYKVRVEDLEDTSRVIVQDALTHVILMGFDADGKFFHINNLDTPVLKLDKNQKDELAMACSIILEVIRREAFEQLNGSTKGYEATGNGSPYLDTVNAMLSSDYKERFKAEYKQLKIRVKKLNDFCNKIEAARGAAEHRDAVEEPKHDCSFELLTHQLMVMREYLHDLEIRAVIEKIDLT